MALTALVAVALWLEMNLIRFEAQRRTMERFSNTSGGWMRAVPDGPAWLRRWSGPGYFERITHIEVHPSSRPLTLADLRGLTDLQGLSLAYVPVTDDDLAALESLKGLELLYICPDQITDSGLMHLRALPKLKELQMGRGPVGQPGRTYFGAPRITPEGRDALRQALPGLKIIDNVAPPGWRVPGMYFPVEDHGKTSVRP